MDIGTVEATHIGYRHHAYTLDSYTDTTDIRFFLSSFTIQEEIELEREKWRVLIEKYHKGCTIIDAVQHVLATGMVSFGATSLGAMLTVAGIPIALAMDTRVVTSGILSIASSRIGKYLKAKMNKQEKIKTLAEKITSYNY